MNAFASALYVGRVMHQRLRPRRHKFDYRGFWFVFDIDEIDALARHFEAVLAQPLQPLQLP